MPGRRVVLHLADCQGPLVAQWISKKYPLGCRSCGRTTVRHSAQGLCSTCYGKPSILEALRNGTLEEAINYETDDISTAGGIGSPADYDDAQSFYGGLDQEINPERQPGSSGPVITPDEVTGPALKESLGDKAKKLFGAKPTTKTPWTGKTNEKSPSKASGKRVSTAESLEDLWTAMGGMAIRTGAHAPLGRYLTWQAPAAGEMLDEAVNGTMLDKRILQPVVKARGRLDMVFAVLGPPGIILAIERNPANAPMLLPMLKSAIRSSLPTMLPAMKKQQAREEKVNKAIAEMFPEIDPGVDPVDLIIQQMFEGWIVPEETPVPEHEPSNA